MAVMAALAVQVASAQPANDEFTNAIVISGYSGAIFGTNTFASTDGCELTYINYPNGSSLDNSVWYKWTAPISGTVEFDTFGSSFDTVLAVYTTVTNDCDPGAVQIAGNDYVSLTVTNSQVTFPALGGSNYWISVNGNVAKPFFGADSGNFFLSWNMSGIPTISSGSFSFTIQQYTNSETDSTIPENSTVSPSVYGARVTVTRQGAANGRVSVPWYTVNDRTVQQIFRTNYYVTNIFSVYQSFITNLSGQTMPATNGYRATNFTVTIVYVSNWFQTFPNGVQFFSYTNSTTNMVLNITNLIYSGDITNGLPSDPPVGTFILNQTNRGPLFPVPTNVVAVNPTTNIFVLPPFPPFNSTTNFSATLGASFTNVTTTNVYQLPSDIVITNVPADNSGGISISSGSVIFDDYQMAADILVPVFQTVGPHFPYVNGNPSSASIYFGIPTLDPQESSDLLPPTAGGSAEIVALSSTFPPSFGVFNFERSAFRVNQDTNVVSARIAVTRKNGNPNEAVSVQYRIDFPEPGNNTNIFQLQAGSDYAFPNTDYTPVTGTLNWAANDFTPQVFFVPIITNSIAEFNEDMRLELFNPSPNPSPTDPGMVLGEVYKANLTILPVNQPAGAVDRTWNRNNSQYSNPPFINFPGTTGNGGTVYSIVEQPDGNTIIAGSFNSFDNNAYNRIVRVTTNGYQDPTFLVSPNTGANDFIAAVALQPDGKIIIGGNFTSFNGNNRHHIARLNSDGTLDNTFNPGLGADGMVWSVALQTSIVQIFPGIFVTNTQVIIGGEFTSVNGTSLNHVARLNPDGSVDGSFNPGVGPDGRVNAVALDSIGRVIIGGDFDLVDGVTSGGVARLNVDGTLDNTFAPGIGTFNPDTLGTDPVYAIAVQPDGQILVAGGFSYLDLVSYNGIVRLNTDGTVDLNFNPGTGTLNPLTGISDTIYSLLLQPNGEILIGGDFTTYNQTRRVGVARLYAGGSLDTTFLDTAYNQFAGLCNLYHNPDAVSGNYPPLNSRNFVYALAQETGGNIFIGGSFSVAGGQDQNQYVNGVLDTGVFYQPSGSGRLSDLRRDATLPRSNVARLVGGATAGPGNVGFVNSSYSATKDAGSLAVLLNRNGVDPVHPGIINNVGNLSANFSPIYGTPGPGIATSSDFSGGGFPVWESMYYEYIGGNNVSWQVNPALYSINSATLPVGTDPPENGPAMVFLSINNNTNVTGNLSANLGLSAPSGYITLGAQRSLFGGWYGGEYIPLGAALDTQTKAPFTIIDNNSAHGTLAFSSPVYSIVNTSNSATITVTRTGGSSGVVQVSYITQDITATNHVDYTSVTNTLTFADGVVSKTFAVPIIFHSGVAPDKTVSLQLYSPSGGAVLGQSTAVLTIVNANYTPGHVSFSSAVFGTNENAGKALITINRLGGSSGQLTVKLISSNGTATNGVNYNGLTNTITWNAGVAGSTNILISVFDDGIVTPDLTVNLRLTNSTAGGNPNATPLAFGGTNATLVISNVDSAGLVQFSASTYSVKEYGGYALIPVVRVGGSVSNVTVNYATADATAQVNQNYSNASGTLTFTNGQVGAFIKVPIIDDGMMDTNLLYLTVSLSGAVPATALGNPSNAVLNIIDTESINETPGTGDGTYGALGLNGTVYGLALQANNQLLVGGDFTQANGVPRRRIARFNSDGTLDAGFSLPSSAYGASDSVRTIAVQTDGRILLGGLFTNVNSVVMSHFARLNYDGSLDSGFAIGSGADNPVYAIAQTFVGGAAKVLIGGSFATVGGTPINAIARLNSDGSLDSGFNPGLGANGTVYALVVQGDGKIIIGGDFTAVNGNTNFNHIARLNVNGSVDSTFNPGSGASDSVRAIAVQPDGGILIGGLFTSVNGVGLNHIARLNSNGSVDPNFQPGVGASDTVYSIALQSDNRIVVGGQFTKCSNVSRSRITRLNPDGSVDPTINFGTGADDFVAVTVIQQDTIFGYPANVPDEKILIGGGFTHYNGQPHAHLARIYGGSISGVGAFEFSTSDYSVDEIGSNAVVTVIRTGGTAGPNPGGTGDIIVPFYTADGTALADIDHGGVTNYLYTTNNLDFPVGEVIQTVQVPVIHDFVVTSNLTVNLALNPAPPAAFGDQPTAVLSIINDDSAISFASPAYTIAKNTINGLATINVVRLASTSGTSTVSFNTVGGTATAFADYIPVSTNITFAPGISNVAVTIPILNNTNSTGNRTVTMQLSGATGSVLYDPSNAVLTILDTVNQAGELTFAATNYTVTEGGGVGYTNAVINLLRTNGTLGTVSVRYQTLDGTAVAPGKYMATNGVVTFAQGATAASFVVPVVNTPSAEGPQYLTVLLTNATGGATLLAPTNATVTILNTNIGLAFALATNSFPENGGTVFNGNPHTVFVNVVRYNNTNTTSTVDYATTDGTAMSNVNYTISTGTLTFNPGDAVKSVPVQLIHVPGVTGTLTFNVNLSNPSAGTQLTAPSTTVVQELDAETGISFATNATSVLKTQGFALLPVICSNPRVAPVSVHYSTGGGTAVPGVDYTAANGTLAFTNGQSVGYVPVQILPNGLLQSNLTFNVVLSGPSSPGVVLPPATNTVTIIETSIPAGFDPNSPLVVSGDWGSTNLDNFTAGGGVVWFSWTPTNSGEVEMDTIGSADDTLGITNLTTFMGVFTGNNAANTIVVNTGLYPNPLQNYSAQNVFNMSSSNILSLQVPGPLIYSIAVNYLQPFSGPSQVRFNAVAGRTYYIGVETLPGVLSEFTSESFFGNIPLVLQNNAVFSPSAGMVRLNWALHPSGVFRFAQEDVDATGLTYSNGMPMLLYRVSETEQSRRPTGTVNANQYNSTLYGTTYLNGIHAGYTFDIPGLLVTVTRVAGSSGRVQVGYTTEDIGFNSSLMGGNGTLVNGDLPASSISFVQSNLVVSADYTPVSGVMTFDDSEMSKTIFVPIIDDGGLPRQNRDFLIVLTNATLDSAESPGVQAPRLDPTFSTTLVRILDADISPQGPSRIGMLVTNFNPILNTNVVSTNFVYNIQPTNSVFNFSKAHYRVTRDVSDFWGNTPITLYVNRMGTNTSSETIHWRINSDYLDNVSSDLIQGEFPLQACSDYATPTPVSNPGILGLVSDFSSANSGTLNFPSGNGAFNPQPVTFTITNNGLQQFNEDFRVSLYFEKNNATFPVGMIDQTTVTILFDDNHPPAGSVDEFYNADFSYNMTGPIPTVPPQMSKPGTDGEVFGLAVQPDDKTVIVGDFFTYDLSARNRIARINTDGSLDTTFNPGSGLNNFAACIAPVGTNQFIIGGAFSSYNGVLRNGLARINANGSLDFSFNPGTGVNGPVYAVMPLSTGKVLIGGAFTSYNGVPRKYLAQINSDGSLDPAFDPGTNINAAVYAMTQLPGVTNQIIVGGDFTSAGGVAGQDHIARLNADGSFDPVFDPGSGANAAVFALAAQPDGNIVVGGEFSQMNGAAAGNLARVNSNGFTDPGFFGGVGADGPIYSLAVNTTPILWTTNSIASTNPPAVAQTNFTIYAGGAFTTVNGTHRLGFARLNPDGTVDTTFLDTAYNQFAGLPRTRYSDPIARVLTSGVQSDGKVMIGGSFARVGGGQSDDQDVRPESIDTNNVLIANSYVSSAQKTRTGIRNRNNVARLIGGATPGPGNIGMLYPSYSINKSQTPLFVSLIRTNGTLGPVSANFGVLSGLAMANVDYNYVGLSPMYWTAWEIVNPMGRMHSDGFFGTNGFVNDVYNRFFSGASPLLLGSVSVDIIDNSNSLNNLSAQFQMSCPPNADQFYLGGDDIPLGVALGESVAPFTLIDDHHVSGTFSFGSSDYIGTGNSASISVTRSNGTYGVVSLNYATTTNGSTAILNSDYAAASGTLTFQPADTGKTFTVPILNSNWTSSAEKIVNLTLSGLNPPVNGIASWGLSNAVLRIINPNFEGFLSLNTNAYDADLSAGSATITVTRTVGSKGTLTVQLATTNGTAVSGVDYVGSTNTLQWNDGDVAPKTVTVPLINNGAIGGGKQFYVSLYNPALNGIGTPTLFATNAVTFAPVLINNDNSYGSFQFSSPAYVVNENGGYATLTVVRTGGTNGTVMVTFATADASAFANTNYIGTNGTLTFVPGQLAASFKVPVLNDGVVNPPPGAFYFTASLATTNAGATIGAPSTANVDIVDAQSFNRPPGSEDTTFNTGAGMNSDVFALGLQSSGQIIAGGGFTIVNAVPEGYLCRLNTDGSLDRSGFLYGLAGANAPVYAVAVQTDDKVLVGGAFTNFNGTILNGITRLNTDGSLDSSFNPGAAADNTVYALAETFFGAVRKIYVAGAFGSMDGVGSPSVARLNDNGSVDFGFATGAGPNGTVYALAVYPTNSPFAGKVLIGGAFNTVNNVAIGHVARLNVDGSVDTNFDANLAVGANDAVRAIALQSDGAVLIGGDFTNVNGLAQNHIARLNPDGSLDAAFAAALGMGANATVNTLQIQADNRVVVGGQFTQASGVTRNRITRLLPTGAVDPTINFGDGANGAVNAAVIQPADQMIVIGGSFTQYDDQLAGHIARIYGGSITGSGVFKFSAASYQVDENGVQSIIPVRRIGGTTGPLVDGSGSVSVNFATITNGSSAVAGVNYSNVNALLSFPPGEVLKFVSVPVMDDSNVTANLTVNLTLSNPSAPAGLGDQTNAVLTIINDDSAVSFGAAGYAVPKSILTGFGTIDVARIGSSSGTCSVYLTTTTNGTAVPGVDFFPTNLVVTFNPGQTDAVVQIPIINNTNPGPNLTVIFALSNAVNSLLYSPSNTTLTIINTVNAPGQLSFSATNYTANASAGNAIVTVQRIYGTSGSVSASYTTMPGSAIPGVDYTTATGSVTFNDGQSNATFAVPLLNNNQAQGPVNLTVVLSNPTGGAGLTTPTNATVTIVNTNVVIAFAAATNTFTELAGVVPVTVMRFNNTNVTSTVDYSTFDGTAQSNVNYTASSATITFNPGQASKTILLTLLHDTNATGTVAFTMSLFNPGVGVQLATPSTTTIQELDAEAGLSFTNSALTVTRNTGVIFIPVVCSNTNVQPVILNSNTVPLQVNYITADGTAVAGQDYVAASGTVVFTNGIATNSFPIVILNSSQTGTRYFTVTLTNVTAPGQLVPPSTMTVTIVDGVGVVKFSSPAYSVVKSAGSAAITVFRTGFTDSVASVDYIATNGTAVGGLHFTPVSGTLVFSNGVTSQSFNVPVTDTVSVQPDLTVLLQLMNPTNSLLTSPNAATLTIHDNSGSYVVPAGSVFAPGGDTNYDGIIDTNETVTILFAFRDAGGTNVTELFARLLATNGVAMPHANISDDPPVQDYGPLTYLGHAVSRAFTFTAQGTNGQQIAATFNLTNRVSGVDHFIGTGVFGYTIGTQTTTFSNTAMIIINDNAAADPYPSTINVSGLNGTVVKTTLTLTNLTHASPSDIEALLVSPDQKDTLIMANAGGSGGNSALKSATIGFDDATNYPYLPQFDKITNGVYRPTQYTPITPFPQ
jgi:uncharacterized delta-60 repeat protein